MVKRSTRRLVGNVLFYGGASTIILMHLPIIVSEVPTAVNNMHGLINALAAVGMLIGGTWGRR